MGQSTEIPTNTPIFKHIQHSAASNRFNPDRLLEAAKRAVEIAIEQDEAAGMAYLAQAAHAI